MPLTVKQVQALTADMPPRCRAMVVVRAGLGLRIGELLGDSEDRTRQAVDAAWRAMDVPSTAADEGLAGR